MQDAEDDAELTRLDHIRYFIRTLVSVFGQTLLWVASARGVDYATPRGGDTVFRPLFFTWLGMALLSMTDSISANAWIEREVRRLGQFDLTLLGSRSVVSFAPFVVSLQTSLWHNLAYFCFAITH